MSYVIFISGTNSGFGKLMSQQLAKLEHQVVAGMRNVNTKNAAAAAELGAMNNIEVVEVDVTSTESFNYAVQQALDKFGRIDVLINNAGVAGFAPFEAVSIQSMKDIFEVNLWGTLRGYQAVLPSMRKQKSGLIISITSGLGIISAPYIAPYVGSKYAIEGMTEAIRYELRNFNIEAVTLQPGNYPTGIEAKLSGANRPEILASYGNEIMEEVQHFGEKMFAKSSEYQMDPQEVSEAITALISMKPGTRPFFTSVNRVTDNLEQEYADAKLPLRIEWMKRMGWADWV